MSATEAPARPRVLAPDLARGGMLLLIAVANTPWYLWGHEPRPSTIHPPGGSVLDRMIQLFSIIAVDLRVYPLFAFLFGYGMMQTLTRQGTLARLRRRNLWLLVFGFVHAALLWQGDILGAYGLAGLVLAWLFLRRADRTLLIWAATGTVLVFLLAVITVVAEPPPGLSYVSLGAAPSGQEEPLAAVVDRLTFWPVVTVGQGLLGLTLPVAIVLGFWAARRRVLEEPGAHLRLLRRVAFTGVTIGWLGGVPHAAAALGRLPIPPESMVAFEMTQLATGLPAGLGYAAVFGLLGHRLAGKPPGPVVRGVTAVGRRSLSAYLAQSVLCAPVLAAWGLGLGAHLHSAAVAAYAVAVWLITLAAAVLLDRPGPAETLLRWLTRSSAPRRNRCRPG